MLELDAGILGREAPVDTPAASVARRLPLGLGGLERLVQRRGHVGVEVVLHQDDLFGVGKWTSTRSLTQCAQSMRVRRADPHLPPAAQRLTHQNDVGAAGNTSEVHS